MGDDFEFSSDDEAEMLAATDDVVNGKRNNLNEHDTTHPQKRVKTNDGSSMTISPSTVLANNVLKSRFGLNGFRLEQEAAITRILDGGSAVVVFPTGGGKSLCYQVSSCVRKSAALLLT
jgi:superfamily II DNA helicase RecQ